MCKMYSFFALKRMYEIRRHLLPPTLNTTQLPTKSALLKVCVTSWKLPHLAFFVILYQARNDTPQSECALLASRICLRLITFTANLRRLRSNCQSESSHLTKSVDGHTTLRLNPHPSRTE